MYYEEKQIDGVWYWRGAPDDDWTPFNATKLYQKLAQKDARIAELEKFAREFLLYFTSSNGIPVERATIKADSDIVHMARALMESKS